MLTSTLHLGIFYVPQICDMGPMALLPLWRKACWGFFRPEKSWLLWPGLNLLTWVLKGSILPLDHRSCVMGVLLTNEQQNLMFWTSTEISLQFYIFRKFSHSAVTCNTFRFLAETKVLVLLLSMLITVFSIWCMVYVSSKSIKHKRGADIWCKEKCESTCE